MYRRLFIIQCFTMPIRPRLSTSQHNSVNCTTDRHNVRYRSMVTHWWQHDVVSMATRYLTQSRSLDTFPGNVATVQRQRFHEKLSTVFFRGQKRDGMFMSKPRRRSC